MLYLLHLITLSLYRYHGRTYLAKKLMMSLYNYYLLTYSQKKYTLLNSFCPALTAVFGLRHWKFTSTLITEFRHGHAMNVQVGIFLSFDAGIAANSPPSRDIWFRVSLSRREIAIGMLD